MCVFMSVKRLTDRKLDPHFSTITTSNILMTLEYRKRLLRPTHTYTVYIILYIYIYIYIYIHIFICVFVYVNL